MIIDAEYLNKNVGPTTYIATSIDELNSILSVIRSYTASKSVNDVLITSITPIPANYAGSCSISLTNTGTDTSVVNTINTNKTINGGLTNILLQVTCAYLILLDISPTGA